MASRILREIDAVMAAKAAILGDDHGQRQAGRNARKRHVHALDPLAGHAPPQHHGRDRLAESIKRRQHVRQQQHEPARRNPTARNGRGTRGSRSTSWATAMRLPG